MFPLKQPPSTKTVPSNPAALLQFNADGMLEFNGRNYFSIIPTAEKIIAKKICHAHLENLKVVENGLPAYGTPEEAIIN